MRRVRIFLFVPGLVLLCLCSVAWGWVQYSGAVSTYSSVDAAPGALVAVVPGAALAANGSPSAVLRERADVAADLYRAGKVQKILVTGDDTDRYHNEVLPVGKYLAAAGIPERDIFLDHAGVDTYSSLYRARDVFGATSVIIVTQPFHLPRALFIARMLGISATGLEATRGSSYIYNTLREVPATVKAVWDVATARVPAYLGEPIPITGDGSVTW